MNFINHYIFIGTIDEWWKYKEAHENDRCFHTLLTDLCGSESFLLKRIHIMKETIAYYILHKILPEDDDNATYVLAIVAGNKEVKALASMTASYAAEIAKKVSPYMKIGLIDPNGEYTKFWWE